MHRGPGEPCDEPANVDFAGLQNGEALADYGQISLIEVAKRCRPRFARDHPVNQLSRIASLLNRYLRDTGQRLAILIERGSITHHKDFRMPRYRDVRLDTHSPGAIGFDIQPLARR